MHHRKKLAAADPHYHRPIATKNDTQRRHHHDSRASPAKQDFANAREASSLAKRFLLLETRPFLPSNHHPQQLQNGSTRGTTSMNSSHLTISEPRGKCASICPIEQDTCLPTIVVAQIATQAVWGTSTLATVEKSRERMKRQQGL